MKNVKFTFKDNFLLFIFGVNYLLTYICVIKLKLNDNYKDMARYDLSKIMKRAHNLYKNAHVKYPTFADALRKSWSMAKFEVKVAEERQAIEAETKAREAKVREENEQAAISSVLLRAQIEADRIRREAEAKAERMKGEIAARKEGISYNEYQNRISRTMGYGCGSYCGD